MNGIVQLVLGEFTKIVSGEQNVSPSQRHRRSQSNCAPGQRHGGSFESKAPAAPPRNLGDDLALADCHQKKYGPEVVV